jgi:hypothetical protein
METGQDNNDGSDIFWPGYVDATTNLILNLLFLLTILIVAVFMFALELGRASKFEADKPPVVTVTQEAEEVAKVIDNSPIASIKEDAEDLSKATDPVGENIALKREIKRLNMLLAQRSARDVQSAGSAKTVEAKFNLPKPLKGLDQTFAYESEIIVRFTDEAVSFTPDEHSELLESLKPVAESEQAGIFVEVPEGFSEAKRMGFYRAMAVRNILIEMEMPTERIDVSVVEGKNDANASVVRVRAY